MKTTGFQISTKTPGTYRLCSEGTNTPNRWSKELPPTKLSFDSCESSADETSPPPAPNVSRKGVGYRRSLSYTDAESSVCDKEVLRLLTSEGTPVFNPKRHKYAGENDENSPYKIYADSFRPIANLCKKADGKAVDAGAPFAVAVEGSSSRSSSLTPEVKRLCFTKSQSESALSACSIKKALERSKCMSLVFGLYLRVEFLKVIIFLSFFLLQSRAILV